jgi:uncharacterized protein
MRLTHSQIQAIKTTTTEIFGDDAKVWLFGSRVDDDRRGGDIDLLIQTSESDGLALTRKKIRFLSKLKTRIGEQRVDLVIKTNDQTELPAIVKVAESTGVPL